MVVSSNPTSIIETTPPPSAMKRSWGNFSAIRNFSGVTAHIRSGRRLHRRLNISIIECPSYCVLCVFFPFATVRVFECSNVRMFESSNVRLFECSNVRMSTRRANANTWITRDENGKMFGEGPAWALLFYVPARAGRILLNYRLEKLQGFDRSKSVRFFRQPTEKRITTPPNNLRHRTKKICAGAFEKTYRRTRNRGSCEIERTGRCTAKMPVPLTNQLPTLDPTRWSS